jgi:hypothetical protein
MHQDALETLLRQIGRVFRIAQLTREVTPQIGVGQEKFVDDLLDSGVPRIRIGSNRAGQRITPRMAR